MRKKSSLLIFYIFAATAILAALVLSIGGPGGNFLVGRDMIGNKIVVWKIIGIAGAIILINFLLTDFLFKRERFLSYTLAVSTLIFSLIVAVAVASYFYFW